VFADRVEAGRMLARSLRAFARDPDGIVLGVPRGGVVVAAEVARALELPLDIVATAKVGAPGNPEFAVGAVAADGQVLTNERSGVSPSQVQALSGPALAKVQRSLERFRDGAPEPDLTGKTAIVVDDGIATGLTARAAVSYLRRRGVGRVILAVPVIASESMRVLQPLVDELVAVEVPSVFWAVGEFYRAFGQTEDDEVVALLQAAHSERPGHGARVAES